MAFQPNIVFQNWRHTLNCVYHLQRTNLKKSQSLLNQSVHLCKRHLYCLSSMNYGRIHKHWSYENQGAFCGFGVGQTSVMQHCNKTAAICYNTLTSKHNSWPLKQPWGSSSKKDGMFLVPKARQLNTQDILKSCPPKYQPYLRLIRFDKPIGTFLLLWPCTWSIALAAEAGHLPDMYLLGLFSLGSFIMRGAGCIINDMWDKDIDRMVERTKTRPLASGELSQYQALKFLGLNLSVALAILLQLNWFSVAVGASSMILVIAYPLAKRYTYWPQALLGLTFNFGAMMGWCAVWGRFDPPVFPLYAASFCWTMIYDTIYAHQDKYYDMLIGVRSTALKFGDDTKKWLTGFGSIMISLLTVTGYLCDQTWPYYTGVTATAAHLAYQVYTVDLNNADDCLKKFKSNTQLGAVLFLAIVIGTLLKSKDDKKDASSSEHS